MAVASIKIRITNNETQIVLEAVVKLVVHRARVATEEAIIIVMVAAKATIIIMRVVVAAAVATAEAKVVEVVVVTVGKLAATRIRTSKQMPKR